MIYLTFESANSWCLFLNNNRMGHAKVFVHKCEGGWTIY